MKILQYRMLWGGSAAELTERVEEMIRKGFQPYGLPFVTDSGTLYQSVALYAPKESDDITPTPLHH